MQDQSPTHRRRRRLIAVFSAVLVFASAAAIGALLMRAPITADITTADASMQLTYGPTSALNEPTLPAVATGPGTCTAALVSTMGSSGGITFTWNDVWDGSECLVGGANGLAIDNTGSYAINVVGVDSGSALVGPVGQGSAYEFKIVHPSTGLDFAPNIPVGSRDYVNILVTVSNSAEPGVDVTGESLEIIVEPVFP
ncbi:MAG: hypothetical protein ACR2N9_10580 [Acidimicrobiia bacterium]